MKIGLFNTEHRYSYTNLSVRLEYLFLLFYFIIIRCHNNNSSELVTNLNNYKIVDSICKLLYHENDTFNYKFNNTPLFIISKIKLSDGIYCNYPEKHLVKIKKIDLQYLDKSIESLSNNEIWVFENGIVLFVLKAKSNFLHNQYKILSTKKNMIQFKEFGHKIEQIENLDNDWVIFNWIVYTE